MLWNGATREEVNMIREVVISVAQRLGVKFKGEPVPVPELPNL